MEQDEFLAVGIRAAAAKEGDSRKNNEQ